MLRFATKNDIEQLVNLENEMFNDSIYFKLSEKEFIKILNKNSTLLFVYLENEIIVGYSLGIIINKENIWFNSLAVKKDWQNTSVAKELFNSIENYAKEKHFKSIILEIREDNKALLRRYKGFKYQEWIIIKNYYPDNCSAIRMIKNIRNNNQCI